MKIYNTNSVFQQQRVTTNQRITARTLSTGDVGQTSVKNQTLFSLKAVDTTRLSTLTQATLTRFEDFSPSEITQLTNDAPFLSNLTPAGAKALISDDGYYGVDATSKRIADFVLAGAGDDLDRLKQGRQGVLQGIEDAEKAWGGTLPDLSYASVDQAIKSIDDRISELGGTIVSVRS